MESLSNRSSNFFSYICKCYKHNKGWDQDIQLGSDSYICTSQKKSLPEAVFTMTQENKGYSPVVWFHRDTSKVFFFLRSKKSFFWISATKGISLSEAGENFAVIVHVCVRETETQFGLVKLLPGRVPLSSLFTRFFGRTFNIKEDVAQQQHRLWVVRTTRLLVHLRDISSALCSVHAVWSQTTWLHLDKKCTVSI